MKRPHALHLVAHFHLFLHLQVALPMRSIPMTGAAELDARPWSDEETPGVAKSRMEVAESRRARPLVKKS